MAPQRKALKWLHYLFIGELSLKRLIRSAILIPIVSFVGLLVYGYMFADRIIFQPPTVGYKDGTEITKLTTADGTKISAIYLPNADSQYTILYSHGNAEDLGTNTHKLLALHAMGFSVVGYDYHGYGTSEGRPSEQAAYQDLDAAYDYHYRIEDSAGTYHSARLVSRWSSRGRSCLTPSCWRIDS